MTLTNFFTKRLSDDAVFFSVLFRCCAIVCTSCKVWDLGKRHTKYETTGSGLGWGGEGVGGAGGGWRGDNRGGLVPNLGFEPTTCWSVVHHSGRSASITQVHDENTVRVQQTERHLRTLIEPYHYYTAYIICSLSLPFSPLPAPSSPPGSLLFFFFPPRPPSPPAFSLWLRQSQVGSSHRFFGCCFLLPDVKWHSEFSATQKWTKMGLKWNQ